MADAKGPKVRGGIRKYERKMRGSKKYQGTNIPEETNNLIYNDIISTSLGDKELVRIHPVRHSSAFRATSGSTIATTSTPIDRSISFDNFARTYQGNSDKRQVRKNRYKKPKKQCNNNAMCAEIDRQYKKPSNDHTELLLNMFEESNDDDDDDDYDDDYDACADFGYINKKACSETNGNKLPKNNQSKERSQAAISSKTQYPSLSKSSSVTFTSANLLMSTSATCTEINSPVFDSNCGELCQENRKQRSVRSSTRRQRQVYSKIVDKPIEKSHDQITSRILNISPICSEATTEKRKKIIKDVYKEVDIAETFPMDISPCLITTTTVTQSTSTVVAVTSSSTFTVCTPSASASIALPIPDNVTTNYVDNRVSNEIHLNMNQQQCTDPDMSTVGPKKQSQESSNKFIDWFSNEIEKIIDDDPITENDDEVSKKWKIQKHITKVIEIVGKISNMFIKTCCPIIDTSDFTCTVTTETSSGFTSNNTGVCIDNCNGQDGRIYVQNKIDSNMNHTSLPIRKMSDVYQELYNMFFGRLSTFFGDISLTENQSQEVVKRKGKRIVELMKITNEIFAYFSSTAKTMIELALVDYNLSNTNTNNAAEITYPSTFITTAVYPSAFIATSSNSITSSVATTYPFKSTSTLAAVYPPKSTIAAAQVYTTDACNLSLLQSTTATINPICSDSKMSSLQYDETSPKGTLTEQKEQKNQRKFDFSNESSTHSNDLHTNDTGYERQELTTESLASMLNRFNAMGAHIEFLSIELNELNRAVGYVKSTCPSVTTTSTTLTRNKP